MILDSPWLVLDISPGIACAAIAGAVAVAALRSISRGRES